MEGQREKERAVRKEDGRKKAKKEEWKFLNCFLL